MVAPPPASPTGDVTRIAIVRRLDQEPRTYDRVWEPYLATVGKRIVVGYGRKLNEKMDMGDLLCAHSDDGGATWSEPVVVFDSRQGVGGRRFAYANAVLYHPPGQDTLWYFGMRCPLYWPDSEDAEVCAAYSVDQGRSWQKVELAMSFHSAKIIVAGIQEVDRGGHPEYLLPAHRNTMRWDPMGDARQFVLESDNLLSWRLAGYVPGPPGIFLHEGNIAQGDRPGELKIVMRTAQVRPYRPIDPPTAYSSVSRDGGRTWSPARPEPALYNAVSKGYYGAFSGGRHIYVYSVDHDRTALNYVVESPDGAWSAPRVFYDGHNHNSYPTLEEVSPGLFLCVWDSATDPERKRTAIRFGRLDLSGG